MIQQPTNQTPLALLTVGQFRELMSRAIVHRLEETKSEKKKFVYGLKGIASIFDCSIVTASKIKQSGKIDQAITQVGRKIIVDAELALELAGKKEGGRKK